MKDLRLIPDINRLSVLAALILLAYAVMPFVNLPEISITRNLFGVQLDYTFNFSTYISILVPALSAAGSYWLLNTHPAWKEDRYRMQHSILPALTAWVIGQPLVRLPNSPQWWVVFSLGGVLLMLVFVAEYVVVDLKSDQHVIAASVLRAISFALYLFLAIALRSAGLRLYLLLPALVIPLFLVLLRTFYLQTSGKWLLNWSFGITVLIAQVALGFHYLPIAPLTYGLALIGLLYALSDMAIAYESGLPWRKTWPGSAVMLAVFVLLAFLL